MDIRKRIIIAFLLLLVVVTCGTIGYYIIEKWNFLDSVFMTIITLATVGYGETHPLSTNGRIFTIFLIISGMGILLYSISTITAFFVEGELKNILRRKKMEKNISNLKNHYIVCGTGKTGKYIIYEFIKMKEDFIVIEKNEKEIQWFEERNILYINDDATKDEVLLKAKIATAKGIIACLPTDEQNLFMVVSAKVLNPNLRIVAKLEEEINREKFIRAGASEVVSTTAIGGLRMVSVMVRPTVVSFLDMMLRQTDAVLRIDEIQIPEQSKFINSTLKELNLEKKYDIKILAKKEPTTEEYLFNPSENIPIKANDLFIIMGKIDKIKELKSRL